ncbi:HAD-like protein [Serendipita vermifera]|nr:HAD-like protein [Serendipita vermifera]
MSPKLSDFKALSFDCYGTLIDWETGLHNVLKPLLERSGSSWTREQAINAYLEEEHKIESEDPSMLYSKIISTAVERVAGQLGTSLSPDERTTAGESIRGWPPFPDTINALERLSKHYVLIILSNVDLESFGYTRKLLEHGFAFNKILTAQEIGSYKPDEKNFIYMLKTAKEEFGVDREQVLVTAQSLMHDHVPANSLSLASAWISRREATCHVDNVSYTFKFPTLGAMADALEAELQSGTNT